jgi:metallo-beta-lactamase family protein
MHLLEAAGARILLDSGLFQGRRKEAYRFNATLPVDPRQLDAIVLSHAHIDHSGRLPLLVSRGFHGPIYSTAATRDLCGIMLPDLLDRRHTRSLRYHAPRFSLHPGKGC